MRGLYLLAAARRAARRPLLAVRRLVPRRPNPATCKGPVSYSKLCKYDSGAARLLAVAVPIAGDYPCPAGAGPLAVYVVFSEYLGYQYTNLCAKIRPHIGDTSTPEP